MCETKTGCDIADIAPDIELNRVVTDYLQIKFLSGQEGYGLLVQRLLEKSGLEHETDLILEFEQIYLEYQNTKSKREELKRKSEALAKNGNR